MRKCTFNLTLVRLRVTVIDVEKQNIITYSEGVFVALGIQRVLSKRNIVIFDLLRSAVFF